MRRKTVTRAGTLVLAAALALTVNAAALLGGGETPAAETALKALPAEVRTYRDTAVQGRLQAEGVAGETLTYALAEAPKKGAVEIEGDTFTYTPSEGRTGKDTFTYTAADGEGNVSEPAEVTVTIEKPRSGVTYADTAGSPAAAAAQELAELGVFTGAKIGDQYYFEPDRTVTRGEFLALALETAGRETTAVTMTGFCDDAAIPAWAKAYAAAGAADGIVYGVSTEEGAAFQGEDPITFNEAAAVLNRLLAVEDVDLAAWYADREAPSSWAAQAVANLEAVSVLTAGSFGSGAMEETVTRADAARMLAAAAALTEKEPESLWDRLF